MIACPAVKRSRWSASPVEPRHWCSVFVSAQRDLALRGFDLCVWKNAKGRFATVGERIRPGIEPEHAEDGTEFAVIWLHAATSEEVSCFWRGVLAGEALTRLHA